MATGLFAYPNHKNRLGFNPYWLATNCGRGKGISISHNVCFFNQILGLSSGCGGWGERFGESFRYCAATTFHLSHAS